MSIIGYSERGIVNSIAYFLDANPQYRKCFIEELGISLEVDNYDYLFLIEQSFSDFGDSDLIIILKNKNIENEKIVIFIECKVKTSQGNFNINDEFKKIDKALKEVNTSKFKGISSNLFVQLYYKYLMIETKGDTSNFAINEIFLKSKGKPRILGNNEIVQRAFEEIKTAKYYYVAIVPTDEIDNEAFRKKFDQLRLNIPSEDVYLRNWGEIESFFKKIGASKVLDVFEYNNAKNNKGQIY